MEELNAFITNLNSIHQNLKFTHEHSSCTIDFLDLTVYKGSNFPFTNRLDTKTFQKPLNLYQYLHFTSNHPPKVFKALIKGECIRFARTNSLKEMFDTTVHLFKKRLLKRDYPKVFIAKATNFSQIPEKTAILISGPTPKNHLLSTTLQVTAATPI